MVEVFGFEAQFARASKALPRQSEPIQLKGRGSLEVPRPPEPVGGGTRRRR